MLRCRLSFKSSSDSDSRTICVNFTAYLLFSRSLARLEAPEVSSAWLLKILVFVAVWRKKKPRSGRAERCIYPSLLKADGRLLAAERPEGARRSVLVMVIKERLCSSPAFWPKRQRSKLLIVHSL